MEPDCKALIDKYVRSDSVIACLELTGYTSALLIRNLDSNQIDQIEEFVRHACTVMNPNQARSFLGSVFSCHADKFCFPIGVRMGLMLAVNELKSTTTTSSSQQQQLSQRPVDKAVQTELTGGGVSASSFLHPNLHFSAGKFPPGGSLGDENHYQYHHNNVGHHQQQPPQQQQQQMRLSSAADLSLSCCSGDGASSNIDHQSVSSEREPKSPLKSPPVAAVAVANAAIGDSPRHLATVKMAPAVSPHYLISGGGQHHQLQSSPSPQQRDRDHRDLHNLQHLHHHHDINIEHLKQHSSASAIRLASRQFVNANLVQNRHFKIDMEVTPAASSTGGPNSGAVASGDGGQVGPAVRVTGIFSCHLCRQKRDRSTPVRFSIARNRYPVMSNVLSHLKIHFQPLVAVTTATGGAGATGAPSLSNTGMSGCDSGPVAIGNGIEMGLDEMGDGDDPGDGGLLHQRRRRHLMMMVKQESQLGPPGGLGNAPSNNGNGGYSQSDSSVGVDSLSPFNLDHLIMAGGIGGGHGPAVHDMKMFSVAAVADKSNR